MDISSMLGTIIAIFGFFGVSFAIEKSPIKFNPMTMIKDFFLKDLTQKVEESEKARIKARANEIKFELSNYEKLASNGFTLTEEDMAFVQELYDEYHDDLKQNHRGTMIYENIEKLYKLQQKNLQN